MWAGVPQGSVFKPLCSFLIFMNTIHHHIHPDTNIACYADDIAIWHSHIDITESEKAPNTTLKELSNPKKVDLPTYLGATLDPELRFQSTSNKLPTKLLKTEYSSKAMRNFLGLKTSNPKSTFCTVIRPVLEYATPIWTPASFR
ncbi:hypothetical protein TNCV_4286301 [Trichonephila clavipes]|nr:hypothetical protein TNCV_4286301 [Trichonephila clavipes]